jgi:hypothetical protein
MDLRGSRLLAHKSVPARALPQGFVAAESAGAEQVLTELLGVRRVSEAETYRFGTLLFKQLAQGLSGSRHHLSSGVGRHCFGGRSILMVFTEAACLWFDDCLPVTYGMPF